MIKISDFSFQYGGSEKPALRSVNLDIGRGEFALLTGPSGCGKSTLALAIAGFLFTQFNGEFSGSVEVAGTPVAEKSIYQTAEVVGLVQQNPESQFCTLTVEDEIVFGLENRRATRDEMEEMLQWSLQAAGIPHLRDRELISLSGGEKQKVALAAILAARPQVIIFDEPTSNLDPPSTEEIFEIILHLQDTADLTVLVIEHKLDFLSRVNPRLIEMEDGSIIHANRKSYPGFSLDISRPAFVNNGSPPLLEVKNLQAGYEERRVLQDISFSVQPGELISLMGDNGSGKSTLLRALLGLLPEHQGLIHFQGEDMTPESASRRGKRMGLVFQNPDHQIFAASVWDEAVFGPDNYSLPEEDYRALTQSLLERAGLGGRLDDHPYRLSFGQKRRLNLISVLAYQPRLLLLDEIFIGQDWDNAHFLLQLLVDYVKNGGSVIMVNHNPRFYSPLATRLLFLSQGRLVIDAPLPDALDQLVDLGKHAYLPGGSS